MAILDSNVLAYSGKRTPGFTENGSYDRCIWDSNGECIESTSKAVSLIQSCIQNFRRSASTRLVARMKVSKGVDMQRIHRTIGDVECHEIVAWPDINHEQMHVTVGLNTPERAVPAHHVQEIQHRVREKIAEATPPSFEKHALSVLQDCRERGLYFDEHPTHEDIFELWNHTFGWSKEQCRTYAESHSKDEKLFVLRNASHRAISGVLITDGESTEWATLPEFQRQGHIVPLLIYANCALLRDKVPSVFAELRWNRSVSPALKSGFRIDADTVGSWLLTNHVAIGDGSEIDPPDPWNANMPTFGANTDGTMLRSFVVGHVEPKNFSDTIIDAYLHAP